MARNASPVVSIIGLTIVGIAFLALVIIPGTPAVRHDWIFPLDGHSFVQRAFDLGLGWSANGLGQPTPYPMTYWVMLPLAAIASIAGGRLATILLLAAVPAVAAFVAIKISDRSNLPWFGTVAIGAILLFNPWTYNKVCAGHVTQTISLFGSALVFSELLDRQPRRRELTFAAILSTLQTQFFLIVIAACLCRIRSRSVAYALALALLVFSPSLIGIALDRGTLLHWPFVIAWESDQSVQLSRGIQLLGYFPRYALPAFSGIASIGNILLLACAVAATVLVRNARSIVALAGALAAVLVASGTTGPIGAIWQWAIVHLPVVGVYRELYDIIGVAAAGYIIAASTLAGRFRAASVALVCIAIVDTAAWFVTPPARLWVESQNIPRRPPLADMGARYALMPAFQPVSFKGKGEGADPLYVGSSPVNVPTNFLWPTYPADAALATYAQRGDWGPLAAIGTHTIVCRPGFEESVGARLFYHLKKKADSCEDQTLNSAPLLSLASTTYRCSLCNEIGADNVFFGDAGVHVDRVAQQRVYENPHDGWIDVRLIFAQQPSLAQPLGGAYTTQSTKALAIPSARHLLVYATGSLVSDDGMLLAHDTRGYTWINNLQHKDSVRCIGSCVVALATDDVPAPLNAAPVPGLAIDFSRPLPFVVIARVPAQSGTLRFLETFDPSWTAMSLDTAMVLKHQRIDATFNAWNIPPHDTPMRVIIFERTALLQALASIFGVAAIAFAILNTRKNAGQGESSETQESGSDCFPSPA